MALIDQILNSFNAINWDNLKNETIPAFREGENYFAAVVLGKFTATDIEGAINSLTGTASQSNYRYVMMLLDIARRFNLSISDTVVKNALDFVPVFSGKHLPPTWNYNGVDYFLMYRNGFSSLYYYAKRLGYQTSKFDPAQAASELIGVFQAAGNIGVLGANPTNNSYYAGTGRTYDEHLESADALLQLYEVNNSISNALAYARDTLWTYVNNNFWSTDHFVYRSGDSGYECEGAAIALIAGKMRALNGYSLTNWDRVITDINNRFLAKGWDSPQWTYGTTRYYSVVHHHDTNSQRRLVNTFVAWYTLHAFYQVLDSTSQQAMVNLLQTPAWQYFLSNSGLYDSSTYKFKIYSDDTSTSDTATALGVLTLFLMGIVPQDGSLYAPLMDYVYEGTTPMNRYFLFDPVNRKVRIPVKAGTIKFIYSSQPVSYTFPSSGVYEIVFASDWNSIQSVTKVENLDPSLPYVAPPKPPVFVLETIKPSSVKVKVGSSFSVDVTIRNDGDNGACKISLIDDKENIQDTKQDTITGGGGKKTFTLSGTAPNVVTKVTYKIRYEAV